MDETSEQIEERLRYFIGSNQLNFYVNFNFRALSINFLREISQEINIFELLKYKYEKFTVGLQEEQKMSLENFLMLYFNKYKEFWEDVIYE